MYLFGIYSGLYFSPLHTNSLCLMSYWVSHVGLIFGGSIFGLEMAGYKDVHITRYFTGTKRFIIGLGPFFGGLLTCHLIDTLTLVSCVPACIGLGVILTYLIPAARDAAVPGWMGKTISIWIGYALIALLSTGYFIAIKQSNMQQEGVLFNKLQQQVDVMSESKREPRLMRIHEEMKNPLL